MRYALHAVGLWLRGDIKGATLRYALANRPVAVAGRGGSYIVDDVAYERMCQGGEP